MMEGNDEDPFLAFARVGMANAPVVPLPDNQDSSLKLNLEDSEGSLLLLSPSPSHSPTINARNVLSTPNSYAITPSTSNRNHDSQKHTLKLQVPWSTAGSHGSEVYGFHGDFVDSSSDSSGGLSPPQFEGERNSFSSGLRKACGQDRSLSSKRERMYGQCVPSLNTGDSFESLSKFKLGSAETEESKQDSNLSTDSDWNINARNSYANNGAAMNDNYRRRQGTHDSTESKTDERLGRNAQTPSYANNTNTSGYADENEHSPYTSASSKYSASRRSRSNRRTDESYKFSSSGTLHVPGFTFRHTGLSPSPNRAWDSFGKPASAADTLTFDDENENRRQKQKTPSSTPRINQEEVDNIGNTSPSQLSFKTSYKRQEIDETGDHTNRIYEEPTFPPPLSLSSPTCTDFRHLGYCKSKGSLKSGSSSLINSVAESFSPAPSSLGNLFNKAELVPIGFLGKGASGQVQKALHVTALRIVAIKSVPVFDSAKRGQLVSELKILYDNILPLTTLTPPDGRSSWKDYQSIDSRKTTSPVKLSRNEEKNMDDLEKTLSKVPLEGNSKCPYVVGFYDAFVNHNDSTINLVLEWMDGGSLQDVLDTGGPLNLFDIARVLHCTLRGLRHIHQRRQLHRDIKPSNILLSKTTGVAKLSDFGISHNFGSHSAAMTFIGSMSYMAPERISGDKEGYSYPSDIWSVGLTIYVCATGEYPFQEAYDEQGFWGLVQAISDMPSPQLSPSKAFPLEFCDLVNLCLAKDPNNRPTVSDLLRHPFLAKTFTYKTVMHNDFKSSWMHSDRKQEKKKWQELDKLLDIIAEYHLRHSTKLQHTLPRFHIKKLSSLAQQLGLPSNEKTEEELKTRLKRNFRRMLKRVVPTDM